jgi:hypothetical protein
MALTNKGVFQMANVLVTWSTQTVQHPAGSQPADHFHIGLGVIEADEPISAGQHLFTNVAPGTYQGHGEVCAADGTELQTPVVFTVVVPDQTPVDVPIIVNISGNVQ